VWNGIKDKAIALEGKYVGPGDSPDVVQVAGLYDDINANPPKADINLTLSVKPSAKLMPQPGATVDFRGNPTAYTPSPFMITMTEGCFLDPKTNPPKCISTAPTTTRPGTRRPGTGTRSTTRKPPAH